MLGLEEAVPAAVPRAALADGAIAVARPMISEMPRDILKAVALGGMLFFILYLLVTGDGTLAAVLPILGVYAFAGLRLFPALQQLYRSSAGCKRRAAGAGRLHGDLVETRAPGDGLAAAPRRRRLRLRDRLELVDMQLRLSPGRADGAERADLAVPARTTRRHRRRHRRRQDHRGRPGARAARAAGGRSIRVDGVPVTAAKPPRLAEQHRLRAAADLPDRQHGRANIAFGHAAGADRPGGGRARGADRRAARLRHAELPAGLRHARRRARRAAERRPAPARRHRPRALPRSRRADPRRGDQRARQHHRAGGDGRGAEPRPPEDHRDDRAPADHGAALRPDLHAGARPAGGAGQLRRAAAREPEVPHHGGADA